MKIEDIKKARELIKDTPEIKKLEKFLANGKYVQKIVKKLHWTQRPENKKKLTKVIKAMQNGK